MPANIQPGVVCGEMEVSFDLADVFDSQFVRLDHNALRRLNPKKFPAIPALVDKMGKLSAEAQNLRRALTTYEKCVEDNDPPILYLHWEPSSKQQHSVVVGMLKVAYRQLYLYDGARSCHQVRALCILDFYVHFTRQRMGFGHKLYDFMLQTETRSADESAIDKPSESLLSFMKKHYGLEDPIWQTTHYVVYPGFFSRLGVAVPEKKAEEWVEAPREAVSEKERWGTRGTPRSRVPGAMDGILDHGAQPTATPNRPDSTDLAKQRKWNEWGHSPMW